MSLSKYQETLRCLKNDSPGRWLLTDPHLLYLDDQQSEAYLNAMKDQDYSSKFHDSTVQIINAYKEKVLADAGDEITLIDLGPGYPDKTLPLVQYCNENGIRVRYIPVDISKQFLDVSVKAMQEIVDDIQPIHSTFEELPGCIQIDPDHSCFCMLGLTFMNFESIKILPLLKEIAGNKARVMLASELITDSNPIESILSGYEGLEVQRVAQGPLMNLDMDPRILKYRLDFSDSRVEMGFELLDEVSGDLKEKGLQKGSHVVTAISYRYTMTELEKLLPRYFSATQHFFSRDQNTVLAVCRT